MRKVSPTVEIHLTAEEAAGIRRFLYCMRNASHNHISNLVPTSQERILAERLEEVLAP